MLLAVVAALALLTLAVPRTVALVLQLPANRVLGQLRRGLAVEPGTLDQVVDAEAAASAWIDSGDLWEDVAAAQLGRLRAPPAGQRAARNILLLAESALRRALAARPGDAIAWWQLAWVTDRLERPAEQVTAALHLSLVTGSRVDSLLFPRLQLALARWPHLDDATREALKPQLALALAREPRHFVTLVRRSLAEDEVRTAFRNQPDLLHQYENWLH